MDRESDRRRSADVQSHLVCTTVEDQSEGGNRRLKKDVY